MPTSSNSFPVRKRLAEQEVRSVLQHGRRATDKVFELKFMVRAVHDSVLGARLAIAVPKRLLKQAVARNRIKRLVRESFRRHAISKAPQDLLVTYKTARTARLRADRTELRSRIEALFGAVLVRTNLGQATGTIV